LLAAIEIQSALNGYMRRIMRSIEMTKKNSVNVERRERWNSGSAEANAKTGPAEQDRWSN
jgi:hypothetical protein